MIGHTMAQRDLMGVYRRGEAVHGYPSWATKEEDGGKRRFLFRAKDTGRWVAVHDKKQIGMSEYDLRRSGGVIMSKAAAELPWTEGIEWQYLLEGEFSHDNKWVDDAALQCSEVEFRSLACDRDLHVTHTPSTPPSCHALTRSTRHFSTLSHTHSLSLSSCRERTPDWRGLRRRLRRRQIGWRQRQSR